MAQTDTKERIMTYLAEFFDSHGYAPTYREIGAHVGLKSPSTVCKYIRCLEREGRISVKTLSPRALAMQRNISAKPAAGTAQRIRLEIADGGSLAFDYSFAKTGSDNVTLLFTGILDASQLKSEVGRVIGCSAEEDSAICTGKNPGKKGRT